MYSKTCVKRPLSKIYFQDQVTLNAGQKYCKMLQGEHSSILSTFIKLSFVIKIFVLSIFECAFYTGFTVHVYCSDAFSLINVACKQAVLMIQIVPCYKCPPQIFYFVFTSTRIANQTDSRVDCRPTHGTARESFRTFTVTRHPNDSKSKATSSLFLVNMIAQLKRN